MPVDMENVLAIDSMFVTIYLDVDIVTSFLEKLEISHPHNLFS